MTSQPFAVVATSKSKAISQMIYMNKQIPKFTAFFLFILPLMSSSWLAGAGTPIAKNDIKLLTLLPNAFTVGWVLQVELTGTY